MAKTLYQLALLAGLTILTGCAQRPVSSVEAWMIPEPLATPYRNELAIARLSEILQRAELTDEQTAKLFFDRGIMFDSVGLRSLARLDFMRAVRLQPDMPQVYNLLGIHYTLSGNFTEAYEAFDSVLELAPDYDFAYLNRAIAFYYAGRVDLAESDFEQFYQLRPQDPFRVLWRYIGFSVQSPDRALLDLQQQLLQLDPTDWATNLVRFYAGTINETQLMQSVSHQLNSERQLAERLCEAYFYLAKWHQARANTNQALIYFQQALATNVFEFVEHRYARLEIARLRGEEINSEQQDLN